MPRWMKKFRSDVNPGKLSGLFLRSRTRVTTSVLVFSGIAMVSLSLLDLIGLLTPCSAFQNVDIHTGACKLLTNRRKLASSNLCGIWNIFSSYKLYRRLYFYIIYKERNFIVYCFKKLLTTPICLLKTLYLFHSFRKYTYSFFFFNQKINYLLMKKKGEPNLNLSSLWFCPFQSPLFSF